LNYERELEEKPPIEVSLNRIFLGSPGTGKTSIGKFYGTILADMGLLSKSEGRGIALAYFVILHDRSRVNNSYNQPGWHHLLDELLGLTASYSCN
jgi:hypothetical protein